MFLVLRVTAIRICAQWLSLIYWLLLYRYALILISSAIVRSGYIISILLVLILATVRIIHDIFIIFVVVEAHIIGLWPIIIIDVVVCIASFIMIPIVWPYLVIEWLLNWRLVWVFTIVWILVWTWVIAWRSIIMIRLICWLTVNTLINCMVVISRRDTTSTVRIPTFSTVIG